MALSSPMFGVTVGAHRGRAVRSDPRPSGWSRLRRVLACALAVVLFAGCPSREARLALRNCRFDLRSVGVRDLTLSDMKLDVVIGIFNPNDIAVEVDRFDYTLFVNDVRAAVGHSPGGLTIPVNGNGDLLVHARVTHVDAAQLLAGLLLGGRHHAVLRGTVYVRVWGSDRPFPIELARDFDTPRPSSLPGMLFRL